MLAPSRVVRAAAIVLAVGSAAQARSVDLGFSPLTQSVPLGASVNVKIVVSSPGPAGQPWDALDAIIKWDPTFLKLTGTTQVGAGATFFLTGFLPDPDGVNSNTMDGTVIFSALAPPGQTVIAPPAPAQLVVTTLKFQALVRTPDTLVNYLPSIGLFGHTAVYLAGGLVTGDISAVAEVEILTAVCPGDGNCFTVHGTPGCEDGACCDLICAFDPHCCLTQWDATCVDEAALFCVGCGNPNAGDCCAAHPDPFCDNRTCCDLVCAIDATCCSSAWDLACVNAAATFPQCGCAVACPPSLHNCFTVGPAGCSDVACCDAVCAIDQSCCTTAWDANCVALASQLCDGCGDPAAGDCCAAHADPFCNDRTCCLAVCAGDSFCCLIAWDSTCAGEAFELCDCPCPDSPHNCFTAGMPGCADESCCGLVCAIDGYCCVVAWDSVCIGEASTLCNGCGDPAAGSCCAVHGTPFCDNRACCTQVCAMDTFCCDTEWDDICVAETLSFPACGCDPCLASNETCFDVHATPGCEDSACCTAVCDIDPSCCGTAWDIDCKNAANVLCGGCGDPASGNCFCPHPNVGCNNATCCRTVCAVDPFCCEVQWDGFCADEANMLCTCRFDFNNDGLVDGADLGLLLAAWGTNQCPYDANNSGSVDGADLGLLLAAWGPCP